MRNKTHRYYDIPREFDLKRKNTPQYSFGKGRDVCKKPEFKVIKETPGVGTYNIGKNLGEGALSFSIFGREWANRKISPSHSLITPGPGHYEETLKTNSKGDYISSLYGNTWKIRFSGPERFKYDINTPGPGSYDIFSDFNGYTDIHKKCKCGRRLGHPPLYEGSTACTTNPKMTTLSVDKKYKNLKLNMTETNNSKENGTNKDKDLKYITIN